MRILIILAVLLLLITGCDNPEAEDSQFIQWQKLKSEAYKEALASHNVVTANLTNQLNQSKVELSALQAKNKALQSTADGLKAQVDTLPPWEELQVVKQKLGEALAVAATAKAMRDLKQKDYDALWNDYVSMKERFNDIYAVLDEVNARDNLTITSNLTADEQIIFYRGWDPLFLTFPKK